MHRLTDNIHFYNLVQGDYDVFDLRSEGDWNAAHISCAVRPVDPVHDETLGERYDKVVVYGREEGGSLLGTDAYRSFLTYYSKRYPSSPPIFVLQDPFEDFARSYPILITPKPASIPATLSDIVLPSKIMPHLYLSAAICSTDRRVLDILGIGFILNATTECPNVFSGQGIEYMRCALVDDVTTEIIPQFEGAIQFIERARTANKGVLIHCAYGVSRSATLVLAYVMHHHRWSYQRAFQHVHQMRDVVRPNRGFVAQLVTWGKHLGVENSK